MYQVPDQLAGPTPGGRPTPRAQDKAVAACLRNEAERLTGVALTEAVK